MASCGGPSALPSSWEAPDRVQAWVASLGGCPAGSTPSSPPTTGSRWSSAVSDCGLHKLCSHQFIAALHDRDGASVGGPAAVHWLYDLERLLVTGGGRRGKGSSPCAGMCVATHPTGQGPRAVSEPTCLRRDAASVIFNLPKYHVIDAPSHHNRGGSDSDPEPHRDGVPGRTAAQPARECDEQPGQRRQPSRSALNTHIYPEGRCGAGRRLACDEIPRLVALCWPILDAGGQSR